MDAQASLLAEIERTLADESGATPARILSRVTDLLLGATRCDEEQIRLYDEVMGRLVERIETAALAQLSERLAPVDRAPPVLIQNLAMNDEISVAGPVLSRSPCLSDHHLITIANGKSQAHLLAISSRDRLSEPLTDVLVSRGESEVAQRVVANSGARISEAGFNLLAKRAEADEVLALRIVGRPDLPLRVFCALLACATEVARERLLSATRQENHIRVHEIVTRVSGAIADEVSEPRNFAAALRKVLLRHASGNLNEEDVVYFAQLGQLEETVAALSVVWSVPIDVTERVVCRAPINVLLLCSKGAGFGWSTVRAIIQIRPAEPSPQRLVELRNDFAALSETTARGALSACQRGERRAALIETNYRVTGYAGGGNMG